MSAGAPTNPAGGPSAAAAFRSRLRPSVTSIRTKLIVLHTAFSLALGVILLLALRVPITELVSEAEERECRLAMELLIASPEKAMAMKVEGLAFARGSASELEIPETLSQRLRAAADQTVMTRGDDGSPIAFRYDSASDRFLRAADRSVSARSVVNRLYLLLIVALLSVYGVIALTLEVFVLPKQVYGPIERLRRADLAVQEGVREEELIPTAQIPQDELGEIMRSRNQSILKLREKEHELEVALQRLENGAAELRRKNHLLETARRNLEDQDRLASLGMMSAGIAHELNTPLAVLKGSVEDIARNPAKGVDPERAALMHRVVTRLERLGDSLLDFARVRPPTSRPFDLAEIIREAWTLVSLDREARAVEFADRVAPGTRAVGDPDRLTQVFVNLLRNAIDAMDSGERAKRITITAAEAERDGRRWLSITVADTGPGIAPEMFSRLFEPFTSTRLDSHGTGLGLAVAEGIVKEHGGVLLARNAGPQGSSESGAEFEVMLPADSAGDAGNSPAGGLPGYAGANV